MTDYEPKFNCEMCGIKGARNSAHEIFKKYPSGKIETMLVCYMCFRQVQNAGRLLTRVGEGRYTNLSINKND